MTSPVEDAIKGLVDAHHAELFARLTELGPGWAIGSRLKPAEYDPVVGFPSMLKIEFETHEVRVPADLDFIGHAGFLYVIRKEET